MLSHLRLTLFTRTKHTHVGLQMQKQRQEQQRGDDDSDRSPQHGKICEQEPSCNAHLNAYVRYRASSALPTVLSDAGLCNCRWWCRCLSLKPDQCWRANASVCRRLLSTLPRASFLPASARALGGYVCGCVDELIADCRPAFASGRLNTSVTQARRSALSPHHGTSVGREGVCVSVRRAGLRVRVPGD